MPTTAERLDRLEAENADLRARLASVEGEPEPIKPPAPPVQTYREPRVALRQVTSISGLVMPSDDEMRALYLIVSAAHPSCVRKPTRGEWGEIPFREFVAAFVAIGNLGRTPQLDSKHSIGWWVDHAIFTAPGASGQRNFSGAQFVLAALAHGDVPYRAWSDSSPAEFGLLPYAGMGTPAGDAWRGVLARGKINPPAELVRVPSDYRGLMQGATHRG